MVAEQRKVRKVNRYAGIPHLRQKREVEACAKQPDLWMNPDVNLTVRATLLHSDTVATLRLHGVGSGAGLSISVGEQLVGVIGGEDLLGFLTKSLARLTFYVGGTTDIDSETAPPVEPDCTFVSLGGEYPELLEAYLLREAAKTQRRSAWAGLRLVPGTKGARQ